MPGITWQVAQLCRLLLGFGLMLQSMGNASTKRFSAPGLLDGRMEAWRRQRKTLLFVRFLSIESNAAGKMANPARSALLTGQLSGPGGAHGQGRPPAYVAAR